MSVVRHTFKTRRFRCEHCEHRAEGLFWDYDPAPICEAHGTMGEVTHSVSNTVMIATDDIPGGMDVPHAICHADGTPRRFYSKSAIRQAAAEAGWTIVGETPKVLQRHVDERGESRGR